ncbi:hypothetical protein ACPEEL_02295 [Pasteurella sp. PK-2025]|uniref:hypothetical protein n=1 Tax=unclassified Pasteurella TaxID=2621516 RepID=UPI003C723226
MAIVLANALNSKGAIYPEQLIYSSGLFYLRTTNSDHLDATCVAEEVEIAKDLELTTTNPQRAVAMWEEWTKDSYSMGYEKAAKDYLGGVI